MDNMNENVGLISQEISKLIEVIETQVTLKGKITKECRELITLKEKCCSQSVMMAATACQGIAMLAERKTVVRSQIISTLISLLPSVVHCNILISTIGSVLLSDLKEPALKNDASSFECFDTADSTKDQYHPLVTVLKSVGKKCWFEIYSCIHDIIKCHEALKIDCKIAFLRPIFNHIFWSSEWRGSPLQTKLFSDLISKINNKAYLKLALETLNWQCVDIHYCMLLLDIITQLLSYKNYESDHIVQALTPALAITIRWITQNGYNPTPWINVMHSSISCGDSSHGVVLYLLTDAVVDAPPQYSSAIIDLCRSIIFGGSCNKYVAYRFVAVSLQWLISPSLLDYPIYRTVQDILLHINELESDWNDKTSSLLNNEYFKQFGRSFFDVKFSVDLVKMTNSWCIGRETLVSWLQNLKKSNHQGTNLNLHLLISGILLCEANKSIIEHCLGILLKLLEQNKDISFPFLRLLFYKLAQETDPAKQKVYLLNLPKLAVKKENIPLVVGIIESLKNGKSNIMKPLIIQLYLTMWKIDGRTYLYLHKLLHDKLDDANDLELNLSRALALREICRLAPHLHGKDVISVVSRVLNECADRSMNGLPSAITIEAIIELCKAHVIDISGTWDAIQPKLSNDARPKVIINLCKFFSVMPSLNPSGKKDEQLIKKIVPLLWEYTLFENDDIVQQAFKALSKFEIENLDLKLFPEFYRKNIGQYMKKEHQKSLMSLSDELHIFSVPYVPAGCWLEFLEEIKENYINEGGNLICTIIERELNSLPRGLFFLPPEKSEPLTYSYLPQTSVCRTFVEHLQKQSKSNDKNIPSHVTEIIRVLSEDYTKLLPPLNWEFLSRFIGRGSDCNRHTLGLLVKQAQQSKSAKQMIESYLSAVDWSCKKLDEITFLYEKIINLCEALCCNVLHEFLRNTLMLSLKHSLESSSHHFCTLLDYLSAVLKNKNINSTHKTVIADNLESIMHSIPPDHMIMESFSSCATEFSMKSINRIILENSLNEFDCDRLRRAVIIRHAIAMRPDIKNPLQWFNRFMETPAIFSRVNHLILSKIVSVIRSRSVCLSVWLEELMWRIQSLIADTESNESVLALIDVFVSVVIVASGYDCIFVNVSQASDKADKIKVFPQSLVMLLRLPDWTNSTSKISLWLQNLIKWKLLPNIHAKAFIESILTMGLLDIDKRMQFINIIYKRS